MEIQPIANLPAQQPQATERSTATPAAQPAVAAAIPAATGSLQLAQAVSQLNQTMQSHASDLEFSVDKDSHSTVVKVVDQKTKELIRQMPSVEALEIAKALDRMQGLLVNQKA